MNKFVGFLAVFCFIGIIVLSGLNYVQTGQLQRALESQGSMVLVTPASFEDHALDTSESIAKAGYNAVVAVAISGDISQTQMFQNYTLGIWGLAVIFALFLGSLVYMGKKKDEPSCQEKKAVEPHHYPPEPRSSTPNRNYDQDWYSDAGVAYPNHQSENVIKEEK